MESVFQIHFAATLFMTGVIWMVQLVHYPSFCYFEQGSFAAAMKRHQFFTTLVVAPPMLIEFATGTFLLFGSSKHLEYSVPNLAFLLATWGFTFWLSVPKHEKLACGYDKDLIRALVLSNWPRTIAWSARSILLTFWWRVT